VRKEVEEEAIQSSIPAISRLLLAVSQIYSNNPCQSSLYVHFFEIAYSLEMD